MNMNKRIFSLVLALVMVLGTVTAFADVVVKDEDVLAENAKFLESKGVLKGITAGDLQLDNTLLRRDALVMLSRLLGQEDEAKNFKGEPTFTDKGTSALYVPVMAWAETNGYAEGHEDGTFGPMDNVTAQQYGLFLMRALGYDLKGSEDWKIVQDAATTKGLFRNLEGVEETTEVTRGHMAQMTFNALGAKMANEDKTLAEHLGIEMPSAPKAEELEVKEVYTENLAEIVVELSNADLIKNKEALTNANNYRLNNDDAKVYHVDVVEDKAILTLVPYGKVQDQKDVSGLIKGKRYDLTIRNVDPKINKTYKSVLAIDNTIPAVEKVEFIGTHGIKVTTTEPIARLAERNFRLDSRTAMIVEQYGREIILTPYHGKEFAKETVKLEIDQLDDFAGYRSIKTEESMEISADDALPKVEAMYRSGNKLTVVFDRDVYHESVKSYQNRRDLGNVSFDEKRVSFNAKTAEKVDANVVEYTFEREIPRNVEVTIQGVANHFNKAMEKDSVVPVEYKDEYAPVVISSTARVEVDKDSEDNLVVEYNKDTTKDKAKYNDLLNKGHEVGTKKMTITFDKDIAEFSDKDGRLVTNLKAKDFFKLYELDVTRRGEVAAEKVGIEAKVVAKDKVELTFKDIKINNKDRDYDYVLEVRDLSDASRNRMEREYLDFQVVRQGTDFNVTKLSMVERTYFNRRGTEITLVFNDFVDKEKAADRTNYYLGAGAKLAVSEAIVERDGKTVSLVVYEKTPAQLRNDFGVLEISPRVVDLGAPASSVADRFWDLKTEKPIKDVVKPSGAALSFVRAGEEVKKEELIVNKGTNLSDISVGIKGKAGDKAQVAVYNKAGNMEVTLVDEIEIPVDEVEEVKALKNRSLSAGDEYTVIVKMNGQEAKLVVKVVDTDLSVNIVYDADKTIKADNVNDDTKVLVFPYGTNVDALNVEAFTVTAPGTAKVKSVAKTKDIIFITVVAENGDEAIHKVSLEAQEVKTVTVKTAAKDTKLVVVEVKDQLGKVIENITEDKFTVKSGVTSSEVENKITAFLNNADGTYSLTLENDLIDTQNVIVTVDGEPGNLTVQ